MILVLRHVIIESVESDAITSRYYANLIWEKLKPEALPDNSFLSSCIHGHLKSLQTLLCQDTSRYDTVLGAGGGEAF